MDDLKSTWKCIDDKYFKNMTNFYDDQKITIDRNAMYNEG